MTGSTYYITFKRKGKLRTRVIEYSSDKAVIIADRIRAIPGVQLLEVKEMVWRV